MFFTIPVDSFDLGGLVRRCLEDEERVGDVNRDLFVEKRRGSQWPQSGNPCLLGSGPHQPCRHQQRAPNREVR